MLDLKKNIIIIISCMNISFLYSQDILYASADNPIRASASANVSVTIVTPSTISNGADMNFGNIDLNSSVAGTVVLTPAGMRIKTGKLKLPNENGIVTAALFEVTGENNYTYAITLPSDRYIATNMLSGRKVIIDKFTSFPSSTGILNSGNQTISVGARLNINSPQSAEMFSNNSCFEIIINYY